MNIEVISGEGEGKSNRLFFQFPKNFAQMSETEQDSYIDYFAKEIWKTATNDIDKEVGDDNE